MERLFDSRGQHIANLSNDRLYAPGGQNIGRRLSSGDLVDMNGNYLGEVVHSNRLLKRSGRGSSGSHGNAGSTGNIGNFGNPGNIGTLNIAGYADVEL
jgi:hypothetical protein